MHVDCIDISDDNDSPDVSTWNFGAPSLPWFCRARHFPVTGRGHWPLWHLLCNQSNSWQTNYQGMSATYTDAEYFQILSVLVGWGLSESVLSTFLVYWSGARQYEFSWDYFNLSVEQNINLIQLCSTTILVWLWTRQGKTYYRLLCDNALF